MTEEELRQLYRRGLQDRALDARARCVSPEAIQALVERTGSEAERLRTLDHVMACPACVAEFELLRSVTSAAAQRRGWFGLPGRALAAAASVALLLAGGLVWHQYRRTENEVMRGEMEQLTLLWPAGPVLARGPVTLVWRPAVGARRYAVTLFDATGRVVLARRTTDTTFTLPSTLPHSPGGEYRWSARAELADGTQLGSPILRFTVRRP